jgi:hypothetical protein
MEIPMYDLSFGFGKKVQPVLPTLPDDIEQWPLDRQYAAFCARGDMLNYDERFRRGLGNFLQLVAIPGVMNVGIGWKQETLFIGTECIDVVDEKGNLREVGELIIKYPQASNSFQIENVTRKISNADHPHVSGGNLCLTVGREILTLAITDADYFASTSFILQALRMKRGEVGIGGAYSALSNWPLKSEVNK